MRIHQLSNVARALNFLQEQWGKDSLPAIANESIVNGDVKSTLAITFFIMLKYQIHPILLNKVSFFKELEHMANVLLLFLFRIRLLHRYQVTQDQNQLPKQS
jgi:hypothetical protein